MSRVRIVPIDDTEQTATILEHGIRRRYRGEIDKQSTSLWYLQLPEGYNWTMEDADFMNSLADKLNLLAGWVKS